jgi:hypothetical protein
VPSLLTSNWENFLRDKLETAFPDHKNDEDLNYVIVLFKKVFRDNPPQPRVIVSLVNSIGNLHRQWCPKIPLSHITFYILSKHNNKTIDTNKIINNSFPEPIDSSLLNFPENNLRDSIICLYFNTTVAEASELLLKSPLRKSLLEGNLAEFNNIYKNNKHAITAYIDSILHELCIEKTDLKTIYNILITINDSEILKQLLPNRKTFVLRNIKKMIVSSVVEEKLNEEVCIKANYLINCYKDDVKTIKSIIRTINPKLNQDNLIGKDNTSDDITSAAKGFVLLAKTLNENSLSPKDINFYIKTTEVRFFEFLQYVYSISSLQYTNYIRFFAGQEQEGTADFSEVVSLSSYKDPPFSENIIGAFKMLDELEFDYDKKVLCNNLKSKLISELKHDPFEDAYQKSTNNLLDSILYFQKSEKSVFADFISSLNSQQNGSIIRAYGKNLQKNDYKNAARWLYIQLRCFPTELIPQSTPFTDFDKSYLEKTIEVKEETEENIIKTIKELRNFLKDFDFEITTWFEKIKVDQKNAKLHYILLSEFKDMKNERFDISLDWMYHNWEIFYKISNQHGWKIEFVKLISDEYSIEKKIMEREFEFNQSQFFANLLKFNFKKYFADHCKQELKQLSKEQWDNFFAVQHRVFIILFVCNEINFTLALLNPFQRSYIEFAEKYINGNVNIKYVEHWTHLYKSLNKNKIKSTCDAIFPIIEEKQGNIPIDFFDHYGELLIHKSALRARDCKFMRIFTPIIQGGKEKHIEWLLDVFKSCGFKSIATDDRETILEFVDEVNSKLEDETTSERLKELLNTLFDNIDDSYKINSDE